MEEIIRFLKDEGYEFEVGCREKERRKIMGEEIDSLKKTNDEKKIKLAKRLSWYYFNFHNISCLIKKPDFPVEEDKYGMHYLCSYLEGVVDTAKISIVGVIKALANDEPIDPFCKYLMFTHMYTPEQVKEIGHEEIYRREQKFKEDELPGDSFHQDDGTNGKDYEISGFGWEEDGRGYITVSQKHGNENDIFEEVNIPVPLILDEDWLRKIREYNGGFSQQE